MAFKGFNSILFDFSSVIDTKLSLIKYLYASYRDNKIFNFDIIDKNINNLYLLRTNGEEDLFKSIISDEYLKENYQEFYDKLLERDMDNILKKPYLSETNMKTLINAYSKAGEGVIRTAVRCSNEIEQKCIQSILPNCTIELSSREETNMSKYTRLIVGYWNDALEYRLEEPKSILVVNFRENFSKDNIDLLNPELIISLGDINDIGVISAYK